MEFSLTQLHMNLLNCKVFYHSMAKKVANFIGNFQAPNGKEFEIGFGPYQTRKKNVVVVDCREVTFAFRIPLNPKPIHINNKKALQLKNI